MAVFFLPVSSDQAAHFRESNRRFLRSSCQLLRIKLPVCSYQTSHFLNTDGSILRRKDQLDPRKRCVLTKLILNRLSPYAIDLLGSNDGENFALIQKGIPTLYVAGSPDVEVTRILLSGSTMEYKFIKVIYSNYDSANGDTVQVMEFELRTGVLQESGTE